jgi:acyl-CoA reductase-like NAD-dependent aldehyde dehydrogenase/nicotinamidase-related amidase
LRTPGQAKSIRNRVTPLLLLVDLQRDYLERPGLEPAPGAVIDRAATLVAGCRAMNVPVVHVWTTVSRSTDRRMPHWKRDGRWLCEAGTPGHAPPAPLTPKEHEPVIHKTAYSAFSDGSLDRLLSSRDADVVVVAGVHLHACVRQAAIDAYGRHAVEIWIAEDATASDDPLHAAITRRYLQRRAACFLTVSEILARLEHERSASSRPGQTVVEKRMSAVAATCRTALGAWRQTELAARIHPLERLADKLEAAAPDLVQEMSVKIAKPVRYGSMEVARTAEMLRIVARRAASADDEPSAGAAEVRRLPLGVVACITPWNNPVYIPLSKIAPALAFGNAVLWKPAPQTQSIAERIADLIAELALPPGLVGVVAGDKRAAMAAMEDPGVDAVTLTGSSAAGFAAQEICARRRIPLQAELGGNNGAVVLPDADLEHAAREIAAGAFALAGQRCTANRRVVVHQDCEGTLVERLSRETAALPWGDPRDPATHIGPLVSDAERDRVARLVARAGDDAELLFPHGQENPRVDAFGDVWWPPTIIRCDDPAHELVQEESFAPLLIVQRARDWDHAIELLNGVRQGLVASVFSVSAEICDRFVDEAAAGIVKVNRATADVEVDVPFGGWKGSGIGPPEHGDFDRDFYTRPQTVYR